MYESIFGLNVTPKTVSQTDTHQPNISAKLNLRYQKVNFFFIKTAIENWRLVKSILSPNKNRAFYSEKHNLNTVLVSALLPSTDTVF